MLWSFIISHPHIYVNRNDCFSSDLFIKLFYEVMHFRHNSMHFQYDHPFSAT